MSATWNDKRVVDWRQLQSRISYRLRKDGFALRRHVVKGEKELHSYETKGTIHTYETVKREFRSNYYYIVNLDTGCVTEESVCLITKAVEGKFLKLWEVVFLGVGGQNIVMFSDGRREVVGEFWERLALPTVKITDCIPEPGDKVLEGVT